METPIVSGQKRNALFFKKVEVFEDRIEAGLPLLPKKVIKRDEITSWIEINKKHRQANITWVEVTVFAGKSKCMINSLHWQNFEELKEAMVDGKERDLVREKKTYDRI